MSWRGNFRHTQKPAAFISSGEVIRVREKFPLIYAPMLPCPGFLHGINTRTRLLENPLPIPLHAIHQHRLDRGVAVAVHYQADRVGLPGRTP